MFGDGSHLVLKEISPEWDWMMPATQDTGRAAELWVTGVMARCPPIVDAAIVRIERAHGAWRIYMRDVDAYFARRGTRLTRADARRTIDALAALHDAFWAVDAPPLCALEDLLGLVTRETLQRFLPAGHQFRRDAERGWEVFFDEVPADVTAAATSILSRPAELARRLEAEGTTLVHGDPHYGNIALFPDRVVMLDWSLAAKAPPAIDFAWFLDQSARFIDATREELIEDFRNAEGKRHSERALRLSFVAELVLAGWQYGAIADGPTNEARAARRLDLAWWVDAARSGLDAW